MTKHRESKQKLAPEVSGIERRDFIKFSVGAVSWSFFGTLISGWSASSNSNSNSSSELPTQAIDMNVATTVTRVLSFEHPKQSATPDSRTGLYITELSRTADYSRYWYGEYRFGGGLAVEPRYDLMAEANSRPERRRAKKLAHFFTMSDIHITDKESPNQLIYLQQADARYGAPMSSIYSPVMPYTTHVLDAAMQTINVLHEGNAFDFGLSLGDVCNSSQYNELRWYIDVIDGKPIKPSSGAHLGADSVDYQKPYKAAGLNRSIPWYQVLGNHDHFYIGSFAIDANPELGLREAYTSDQVWAVGNVLKPNSGLFPAVFNSTASLSTPTYYMGVIDGSSNDGAIVHGGDYHPVSRPPTVAPDPDRRPLYREEWIQEFFNSYSAPVGHGFNEVDQDMGDGFACYSFVPKSEIPLKVIVLDNTQSETDGSLDIHGHGFLDEQRWKWLQKELKAGQDNDQLMIIAAHIPIAVGSIGSEMEWWESEKDPNAVEHNAVSLAELVHTLQETPNLLLWLSGHRHFNTVKAFVSPDPENAPERGFWQVETSSLRDFPQQMREFEIFLNSDNSISITTINIDPSVAEGTPAAKSRAYSIATQQILDTDLRRNVKNFRQLDLGGGHTIELTSMDPTRPQDGTTDKSIRYGEVIGVPYCASYNAELFIKLSPRMQTVMEMI